METTSKILIVDDEEAARRYAERALTLAGHKCDSVAGVEEARRAFEAGNYDLLLTDLNLSDGTGTELLRWVAQHHRLVAVVLMTGYPTVASAVEAMRLDAIDYLVKPCEDLPGAIRDALTRAQERRADRNALREWSHALRTLADRVDLRAGSTHGQIHIGPGGGRQLSDAPGWNSLSTREREVTERLVAGDTVREIARSLGISENTVRNHLKATYRKFDVGSQVELMRKIYGQ